MYAYGGLPSNNLLEYKEFACLHDHVGGRTLRSFVFVMITHGGIKPQAARWSLSVWEQRSTEPSWRVPSQAQQKH